MHKILQYHAIWHFNNLTNRTGVQSYRGHLYGGLRCHGGQKGEVLGQVVVMEGADGQSYNADCSDLKQHQCEHSWVHTGPLGEG